MQPQEHLRIRHLPHSHSLFLTALLGAVLLMAGNGACAQAAPCIDYQNYLHRVGELQTSGSSSGLVIDGGLAYVADGFQGDGLLIVDVSDPSHPELVGSAPMSYAWDVAVEWPYVVVADYLGGIHVFDVENPSAPNEVAVLDLHANSVLIDGGVLYLGTSDDVRTYDFTTPAAPVALDILPLPDDVVDIDIEGDLLFAAAAGLRIIDISDPSTLTIAGSLDLGALAGGVSALGSRVIVTSVLAARTYVIDAADPAAPAVLSTVVGSLPFLPWLEGSLALVPVTQGLQVIDLTDPAAPLLVAVLPLPDAGLTVGVAGGLAFVGDGPGGLQIIDISNPHLPDVLGSVNSSALASDVVVSDSHALVADDWGGLTVFDLSEPTSPAFSGHLSLPGRAIGVDIAGAYAFLASADAGLSIIGIGDPSAPELVATFDTPGSAEDVVVSAGVAFVADGSAGVQVLDVDPVNGPSLIGTIPTPADARCVALSGELLLVGTDLAGGLQIFDVTDPGNGQWVGGLDVEAPVSGIASRGSLVALASGVSGVLLVDISNPLFPQVVGTFDTPGHAWKVSIDGTIVYVADFQAGVTVLDAADPSSPVPLGASSNRQANGVWAAGAYVCVADGGNGLSVLPSQCNANSSVDAASHESGLRIESTQNPVRGTVGLRWFTPFQTTAVISIHDVSGRLVITLSEGEFGAGWHELSWNGRDRSGREVVAGRYFARTSTPAGSVASPVVWLR